MNYKIYMVLGNKEPEEIALNEGYSSVSEEDINDILDTFCSLKSVRVALASGIVVAIPEAKMRDVYFVAAPVKE